MPAKKEPGFFTRFGEVLNGTAQKKIRRSIRQQKEMDAKMGRAVVSAGAKKRKAAGKKSAVVTHKRRGNILGF